MKNILLDGFMVTLLLMAIVFCWRLNRKLQGMRQMSVNLSPTLKNLSGHVTQLSQNLDRLRETAEIEHKGLKEQLLNSMALKDDFDILIEHGEKVAERLDTLIEKAQQLEKRLQHTVNTVSRNTAPHTPSTTVTPAREQTPSPGRAHATFGYNGGLLNAHETDASLKKMHRSTEQAFHHDTYQENSHEFAMEQGVLSALRGVR